MPRGGRREGAGRPRKLNDQQRLIVLREYQIQRDKVELEIFRARIAQRFSRHDIDVPLRRISALFDRPLHLGQKQHTLALGVMETGDGISCPDCPSDECECPCVEINDIGSEMRYRAKTLDERRRRFPLGNVRGYKEEAVKRTIQFALDQFGIELLPSYIEDLAKSSPDKEKLKRFD